MEAPRLASRLVVGILLCLCWAGPLRLAQYVHAPVPVEDAVQVEIPPGTPLAGTARVLSTAGLGSWEEGTRWGFRLWGRPRAVKAGRYSFSGPVRLVDVFDDLEAGRVDLVRVTFPEGITAREMGERLERAGITTASAFSALAYDPKSPARWGLPGPSLEGFLFPDTYRWARGVAPVRVAETMIQRFRAVTGALAAEARGRRLDLLGWVTLASIVEKETASSEEKPKVAAVFFNRLRRGMRLETDPTVIYGIPDFDGNLRKKDLRRDTPYNTYTRAGLPPGPICNPGRESLEAVLHPAPVPYLYFVSRNDGTHVFSSSYEAHRRAVDRHQRGNR